MNLVLLSGGSGKRLWPLSNETKPKQFLKVFTRKDGTRESMLQRTFRMLCDVDQNVSITIATSESQAVSIRNQIGDSAGISIEPCRRDTFPAIALATAYLHDVQGIDLNRIVVVCPVDSYVEAEYYERLLLLEKLAEKGEANLVLMGIEPTYPSEKYGYIIPKTDDQISEVVEFKEKPDVSAAKEYIAQGALWNAGIFAYKLKYILDIAEKILGDSSYEGLFNNYTNLAQISFDYAVAEREKKIQVLRYKGKWKDLGTWNSLTEEMDDEISGNASAYLCENTHVINETQIPLVALGVKNLAIVATPNGILITEKTVSDKLKDYVANL